VKLISLPEPSPLVTLRVVFRTGAAQDPFGKHGAAWMTALLLASGGSRTRTHKEILDAFFPLGVSVGSQVDKEMIAFAAETHAETLETFYDIFRGMLLDPGWRKDDFERLRDDAINYLEVGLRGQNDEELAKELLYQRIFADHPYHHHNAGTVRSLQALKIDDLREFYIAQMARDNVTLAIAGGFPQSFDQRFRADFSALPPKARLQPPIPAPPDVTENELYLVEKPARGVAISLGFPIVVRRGHPDFPALLLASSALGQHRMSSGRLFQSMRQIRGLNYGDYAYVEYFPGGMYTLEPDPNFARSHEIFQLWIRPVENGQAHFALRLALYELERLVRDGLTADEFELARRFLPKYSNLLLKTKDAQLGYAIDSDYYGIPPYPEYLQSAFQNLTLEQVNAAIRRHLRAEALKIVLAGENLAPLRQAILDNTPSPITYNSPKPEEILVEDLHIQACPIRVKPENAILVPADQTFA
jgi:zinc protease